MTITRALSDIKVLVEQELRIYFQAKRKEALARYPESVSLVDQIAELTLRDGKRLRPFLCWLGYISVGDNLLIYRKKIPKNLTLAMMALELFQSFALIHDDIIDEDDLRRGGPTVHEYFKSKAQNAKLKVKNPKHFGESMAIIAGDLAFSWALGLLESIDNSKVRSLFTQMAEETMIGQGLDVLLVQAEVAIDKNRINELKTAYYSVVRPLELGAMLAGATDEVLSVLRKYGLAVGHMFQLRDDLLDKSISQKDFNLMTAPFMATVSDVVEKLAVAPDVKEIYREVARFVVTRKT